MHSPLFNLQDPKTARRFRAVDDTVMGGRSHSSVVTSDRALVFAGELSLANNGGFAQVRADLPADALAHSVGVSLRVRGDGRTYRLTVRQDEATYDAEFPTSAGHWTTTRIYWDQMRINLRGQRPAAPPPDPRRIAGLGFLLGDGIPGLFRLEIGAVTLEFERTEDPAERTPDLGNTDTRSRNLPPAR